LRQANIVNRPSRWDHYGLLVAALLVAGVVLIRI
jgi:hypothetical protein